MVTFLQWISPPPPTLAYNLDIKPKNKTLFIFNLNYFKFSIKKYFDFSSTKIHLGQAFNTKFQKQTYIY